MILKEENKDKKDNIKQIVEKAKEELKKNPKIDTEHLKENLVEDILKENNTFPQLTKFLEFMKPLQKGISALKQKVNDKYDEKIKWFAEVFANIIFLNVKDLLKNTIFNGINQNNFMEIFLSYITPKTTR